MYYMETEFEGNHLRIEWNGVATFNIQTAVGGQWVDIECFTCYGIDDDHEAFGYALDWMHENMSEA